MHAHIFFVNKHLKTSWLVTKKKIIMAVYGHYSEMTHKFYNMLFYF